MSGEPFYQDGVIVCVMTDRPAKLVFGSRKIKRVGSP